MRNLILIPFVLISLTVKGQKWTYSSGGNAFDGKYKTSSIIGTGSKSPYRTPMMVINLFEDNTSPSIYFAKAGYSGCDGKKVYLNFDDEDEIYTFHGTENNDKDVWFIEFDYNYTSNGLDIFEVLEKLKKHSYVNVRIKSDCGQNDLKFSLSGSTAAIDFVTKEWIANEKERIKIEKEQEILAQTEKEKGQIKQDSIEKAEELEKQRISKEVNKFLSEIQDNQNYELDSVLKIISSEGYEMIKGFDLKQYFLKKTIENENRLYSKFTDMSPAKIIPQNTLVVVKSFNKSYDKVVYIEKEGEVEYYISKRNLDDVFLEYKNLIYEVKRKNNEIKASKIAQSFPSDIYSVMITTCSTKMYINYTNLKADLIVDGNILIVIEKNKGIENYYKVVYIDGVGQVNLFVSKYFVETVLNNKIN